MSLTKTLYIPVEIIDRELGGALLMAANAASRGWSVVLGGKQAVFSNMSRFRASPGIFFLKSVVPGEVFMQDEIIAHGHRVVSLDVEGLVPSNGEAGVRLRYSSKSIEKSDLLFFWGDEHFAAVREIYPEAQERACVTGSPIIDEVRVRAARYSAMINRKPRKKILIGTSCGFANHINGIEFSRQMRRNAYADNLSDNEKHTLDLEAELDLEIFEYWKKIVPLIAEKFSEYDVVLRPHPSESVKFWKKHLKAYSNLRIDSGKSILEELLGADVYVHFNSTSAIISNILNVPTIMPMPTFDELLRERITYVKDVSILAETEEELFRLISNVLFQRYCSENSKCLSRYCQNLKEKSVPAAVAIINALETKYNFQSNNFTLHRQRYREKLSVSFRRSKYFLLWLLSLFYWAAKRKVDNSLPPVNAYNSARAKQPKTSLRRLKSLIDSLVDKSVLETLQVDKITTNIFIIRLKKRNDSKT